MRGVKRVGPLVTFSVEVRRTATGILLERGRFEHLRQANIFGHAQTDKYWASNFTVTEETE